MFGKVAVILLVGGLAVVLISCGSDKPCAVQAFGYMFEVNLIENDYFNVVDSTIDYLVTVEAAEEALEKSKDLKPPGCAKELHKYLIGRYEAEIAIDKALAIDNDTNMDQLFDDWDEAHEGRLTEIRKIGYFDDWDEAHEAHLTERRKIESGNDG